MSKIPNENQILLLEMIKIYQPNGIDWMSYQITKKNVLTIHHILERCNGGDNSVGNSALLTKKAHRILNILNTREYILYQEWQDLFRYINVLKGPMDDYSQNYSRKLKKYSHDIIYRGY